MNKAAKRKANNALFALGQNYHNGLPLGRIDEILTANGFQPLSEGIYCGREGRITEQVSAKVWLTMTWYKMELTGSYEVVAYVS